MATTIEHFPADPIIELVQGRGGPGAAGLLRSTKLDRAYCIARRQGYVTWKAADDLACALGLHPAELWPNWWDSFA